MCDRFDPKTKDLVSRVDGRDPGKKYNTKGERTTREVVQTNSFRT